MSNASFDKLRTRPIGILDSGIGGLSIWREITILLPHESTLTIGDHAHVPYGTKPMSFIRKRTSTLIEFLLTRKVKLVVIACNTATVAGIEYYRTKFPHLPIVGVVPVVKTAAERSKTKKFAVLSTPFTANSLYQKYLIEEFANGCSALNIGCDTIVEQIEEGNTNSRVMEKKLKRILRPVIQSGCDIIALGCTHFAFIRQLIERIVGTGIAVIDSGPAVARHVARILTHNRLLATSTKPTHLFVTTGDASKVSEVAKKLLGRGIRVKHQSI